MCDLNIYMQCIHITRIELTGKYEYNPGVGEKPEIGTHTITVLFTPKSTAKYQSITRKVKLVVYPKGQPPQPKQDGISGSTSTKSIKKRGALLKSAGSSGMMSPSPSKRADDTSQLDQSSFMTMTPFGSVAEEDAETVGLGDSLADITINSSRLSPNQAHEPDTDTSPMKPKTPRPSSSILRPFVTGIASPKDPTAMTKVKPQSSGQTQRPRATVNVSVRASDGDP
jgi:hypothetical protein